MLLLRSAYGKFWVVGEHPLLTPEGCTQLGLDRAVVTGEVPAHYYVHFHDLLSDLTWTSTNGLDNTAAFQAAVQALRR